MMRLAHILRPTLARRLIVAMLIASGMVWIVLVAYYYVLETGQAARDGERRVRAEIVTAALAKIENAEQVRGAAAFYADVLEASLRRTGQGSHFLLRLEDRQSQRVLVSAGEGAASLRGVAGRLSDVSVNGVPYRVFRGDTPRWTVLIGEPELDERWLLARLGGNLGISVLISFPFVLLPAWLAVTRGLRPLRNLSDTIAARGPDDLAPLGFAPKYGELIPVSAALDRLLARLRTKVAREHTFVQDAAHELRTPLAVISAQAHVLEKAAGADERRVAAQQLQHALSRASHLIQQLLSLAHFDGAGVRNSSNLDVAQLVRQELAGAAPGALARDIELTLEAPDALFHRIDAQAFQSILQNLLSNALRYVPKGGRVLVELSARRGLLSLAVADDGPGIAEAERALVFERFYRVAGSDVSGSGLGLAIVAQAAVRLHGTVRVDTGLDGRGCRFVVELPFPPIKEEK